MTGDLHGTVVEHDGDTYEVVLSYPATADGRLLPVMAVRTEDGAMVAGFENLAAFMLDAAAAAAGRVVVVAKRESPLSLAARFLGGSRVRNTQSGTFGVVASPDGLGSHVSVWPGEEQVCVWWQGTSAPSWTYASVVVLDPLFPEGS